mgnify:CR=1 FL=1|jgi:hypothetical protein
MILSKKVFKDCSITLYDDTMQDGTFTIVENYFDTNIITYTHFTHLQTAKEEFNHLCADVDYNNKGVRK